MTVLVFLDPAYPDGRPADAGVPALMINDLGVTRGDGIFESLLAVDGVPRKPDAHLDRLGSSADLLDLRIPERAAWERAIATALALHAGDAGPTGRAAVKLVATRGVEGAGEATAWVQVTSAPDNAAQQKDGIRVLLLDRGYDSLAASRAPWLLLGAKTLSYAVNMAALRYARANGADDAIFTSSDGKVLEGPTSTVVLATERNGVRTLLTPERRSGILAGTTQDALFRAAEAAGWELGYGPLVPEDLFQADGVWLASSIRMLVPVRSIDGRGLPFSETLNAELVKLADAAL
ncbi:aminodeoxychorismate lyase [Arthrobacter zhangbolii]|uniref:Aminodeoxychorismate lyase n=1 Tax=Arthrobacter zhangbolii TaxID=2886936 RepID=A0A9X1M7I1_9MICC|nr:aminodeoxychorismate lyase [Arthrobacter zhangbolii]MCC3272446.1 aminodeoxychorismate lyase [Arthrobacter zhangbolii]UON91698.1 aminodeoxychorismate lyase [Arthrobacter zhangbolii]